MTINKVAAKGETPYSLKFGETYNDPTGPWLKVARDATFGANVDQALQQAGAEHVERRARGAVTFGSDASHPASRRWGASRAVRRWPWLRSRTLKGIG